jgi:hypothetical protein
VLRLRTCIQDFRVYVVVILYQAGDRVIFAYPDASLFGYANRPVSGSGHRGSVCLYILCFDQFAIFSGSHYICDAANPGRYYRNPCCDAFDQT